MNATPACLCAAIPHNRQGQVWAGNKLVHTFHMDCPTHGIVLGPVLPGGETIYKEWLNQVQFANLRRTGCPYTVLEKAPDGLTALVEWSVWTSTPMEENAAA